MKSNKILFLSSAQYGKFIDHYYCSLILGVDYDVTVISMNEGGESLSNDIVSLFELPHSTGLNRALAIRRQLHNFCDYEFDIVIATYFKGISLCSKELKRISKRCFFDVRTVDISTSWVKKLCFDKLILTESFWFNYHSVITDLVGDRLNISRRNRIVLPLGCKIIDCKPKSYEKLRLLYVGTFNGRRVADTIRALALVRDHGGIDFIYNIIGDGNPKEVQEIVDTISDCALGDFVNYVGYVPTNQLKSYYDISNIGVSYVPINMIYDLQPPTKTLEYLGAGIPVIATKTKANEKLLNSESGILINDSVEDFAFGVIKFWNDRFLYSSVLCQESVSSFTWERVASIISSQL